MVSAAIWRMVRCNTSWLPGGDHQGSPPGYREGIHDVLIYTAHSKDMT